MTEQLVLCGPVRDKDVPKAWKKLKSLELRLGKEKRHVHLQIGSISGHLTTSLPKITTDLVELAAYIYVADQATGRGGRVELEYGSKWRRGFKFVVPVRNPDVWRSPGVKASLRKLLQFLSDDIEYEFEFVPHRRPPDMDTYFSGFSEPEECEEVIMFSGGLDSLSGAAQELLVSQRSVALVRHYPESRIQRVQLQLINELISKRSGIAKQAPIDVAVKANKGRSLERDFTQRSRSFFFAALGVTVARIFGLKRLRFYENGVTSFNLPISGQDVGGRSTRTTHPKTIDGFTKFFTALLELDFVVENPYRWDTKSEVIAKLRNAGCADLCAKAVSCSSTRHLRMPHTHCGKCSQCLERRLAVLSADLSDVEDPGYIYETDVLVGELPEKARILFGPYITRCLEVYDQNSVQEFVAGAGAVAQTLTHLGTRPDLGIQKAFELHKRHAEQVCGVMTQAVQKHSKRIVHHRLPPNCLLAMVCEQLPVLTHGGALSECEEPLHGSDRDVGFDDDSFTVLACGKRCELGNRKEYRLARVLIERFGELVPIEEIQHRVWDGRPAPNTLQRIVSNLRGRLHDKEIYELELKNCNRTHYALQRREPLEPVKKSAKNQR